MDGAEELLGLSAARGVLKKSDIAHRSADAESLIGYKRVSQGDLVCNKMQAWNGVFGISPYAGITSPDYAVYRFYENCEPSFIEYLVKTPLYATDFKCRSNGIGTGFMRLNPSEFLDTDFWLPSMDDQRAVVQFIDIRVNQLDQLVERKNKFIRLLAERMTSSVIEATKPRAEWHSRPFWTIAQPKSISGQVGEALLSVYLDRGVIPYSEGGGLVHKPAESLEKYQLVEPGDLVMNNQQAWRGSLGVSEHRGIVSPAYLIFELDGEELDSAFANYAFRSRHYVDQFMLASMSVGDIQRQIKWPHLRRVMVSLPPLSEQKRIVEELNTRLSRLEGLIASTRLSVTYLQEKRTALITAAVTGKIDVRNAA